ncbi:uncharacterized protein LOC108336406 isoform X2 [Vigna angularis]|nr:uncharacterized protein LOC108336406 isoform X2 [Vigna angularis]
MKLLSSGHRFFTLHHQLAPNSSLNSVTAFSSEVHICIEWWWQWVQLASNGTLYQSAKTYDFKPVAEMLAVKKTSETLNQSNEGMTGYYKLDLYEKLRNYIRNENSRHAKVVKEAKLKIAAAKEKCRQKKENCPIKFCHKCLLSRYGENAEEVVQLANWTCPKCQGICNCSLCQKQRGEQPTSPLYRSAKESGFKSVAEMLAMKKNLETSNPLNLIKESEVFLSGELGNENFSDANVTAVCTKDDGGENFGMNLESKAIAEEILLPPGMELKEIFGIELPPKEVGNALQILEFCRVFGKALDLKEGEAEAIFKELITEEIMDEHNSSLIQFHIRLLGLFVSNSKKEKLRSYIQDENSKDAKVVKETKLKIAAAKEKIKCLAQKFQNENSKVSSIPGEEHDAHIKIRIEVDEAHIEMLRLKSTDKSGCDATRINPEFVDNNGMTFWNLQSYNDESVLLQDMKIQDETVRRKLVCLRSSR